MRWDIISSQTDIIKGALPADTLKLVLEKLDERENELLNAFRGTKKEKEWTAVFELEPKGIKAEPQHQKQAEAAAVPQIADVYKFPLFFFSNQTDAHLLSKYFVPSSNNKFNAELRASNEQIEARLAGTNKKERIFGQLVIHIDPDQPARTIPSTETKKEGSLFYRIPIKAQANLEVNGVVAATEPVYLAQMGPLRQFPRKLKGSKAVIDLGFDTETGALVKVVTQSDAIITSDSVGTLGTSASDLLDAYLDANDEINQLDQKHKKLDLKYKILDLEKKLKEMESEQ